VVLGTAFFYDRTTLIRAIPSTAVRGERYRIEGYRMTEKEITKHIERLQEINKSLTVTETDSVVVQSYELGAFALITNAIKELATLSSNMRNI